MSKKSMYLAYCYVKWREQTELGGKTLRIMYRLAKRNSQLQEIIASNRSRITRASDASLEKATIEVTHP